MSVLTNYLLREIYEAEQRAMQALLEGWDREIEAHRRALIEIDQQKKQEQAQDAALAQSVASYLVGLVEQAKAGDDVTVAVPAGIRVAGPIAGGPSVSAINTLISEVSYADDEAIDHSQRSAAGALRLGFLPHPSDLAHILDLVGRDRPWSEELSKLGHRIDQLDGTPFKNVQLKVHAGRERLDLMSKEVGLLSAYGADRTLALVANPASLTTDRATLPPAAQSVRDRVLDRVLDGWLQKPPAKR